MYINLNLSHIDFIINAIIVKNLLYIRRREKLHLDKKVMLNKKNRTRLSKEQT